MLETGSGISFLPWYAVEKSVERGSLTVLKVRDLYVSLYQQIFCHREKWRTREMEEFVRAVEETHSQRP